MFYTSILYGFFIPEGLILDRQMIANNYPLVREGAVYMNGDVAHQLFYGIEPSIFYNTLGCSISISNEQHLQLDQLCNFILSIFLDNRQNFDYHLQAVIHGDYSDPTEQDVLSTMIEAMNISIF